MTQVSESIRVRAATVDVIVVHMVTKYVHWCDRQ